MGRLDEPLSGGLFQAWQPRYAEHGIATFPVREKKPAVSRYLKMGLPASHQLVSKFANDDAFGLACKPNRITVLDVDAPDERLLSDALSEFGPTPFIVRSGSGNWQAWYRHSGETRNVRPDPDRPIDILGGGFVVAPPSRTTKGNYSLIEGSLDDLDRLPRMRQAAPATAAADQPERARKVQTGQRNEALWRACMTHARSCRVISELMEAAVQMNTTMFYEPLPDVEVLRVVASAWGKELSGENWFGAGQIVPTSFSDIDGLMQVDPDAFILKQKLRREHEGLRNTFVVANAMAETMPLGGWTPKRFAAARRRLEEMNEIELVQPASRHNGPAQYRFKGGRK
jgi:hypothetical protein